MGVQSADSEQRSVWGPGGGGGVSGILDLPSVETRTILPDLCVLGPEMPCCLCCGLWKMLLSGVILLSIVPHFAAVCRGGGWWWFSR